MKTMEVFIAKPKSLPESIHQSGNDNRYRILVHLNPNQRWKCTIMPKECTPFGAHDINYHLVRNNVELHFSKEEFDYYFEKISK